jgi:class 3 adenylate cyclase/tetratricopeptide (TPR) repeat protein
LHGPLGARRRLATVLFCDIAGSTELGERLDPESVRELMLRYFEQMGAAVERHGGFVEKFIGDAVMAVFGIPAAHEDDALRAVRAAAEMQARLGQLNADIGPRYGAPLTMRIGVNTGEVVATDTTAPERFVTGDTVNTAARLQAAAGVDEVVLGSTTYELTHNTVAAELLPPLALKGKRDPVAAYRLVEVGPDAFPPRPVRTPMVGRATELRCLQALFRRVQADHHGALATVVGEAGLGKSRLVRELRESLAGTARVAVGRCASYGEAATFAPLAQIVRSALGLGVGTPVAEAEARLASVIEGPPARGVAAGIGLSREVVALEEVSWALRCFLRRLASRQPLVLIIEDLHWAEDPLLDLLQRLADEADEPVLVLCTARPDLLERYPDWPTAIALEPLSPADAAHIVTSLAEVADDLRQRLIMTAGGNPLFLEELVQLVGERDDRRALPPALHALLGARLDQLPIADRAILERASVEGDLFHVGALRHLSLPDSGTDLAVSLARLEARGLIYQAEPQLADEQAFRFKHTLIRDAAYRSVSKRVRCELHERYAGWRDREAGDTPGEHAEIVGHHLEQAYRHRADLRPHDVQADDLSRRAARQLAAAGRRKLDFGLYAGAADLLGRAGSLLSGDDEERDEVVLDLGHAFVGAGELALAEDAFDEVRRLAQTKGDRRLDLHAVLALLNVRSSVDPALRADELTRAGNEAVREFSNPVDHRGLAKAWWLVSWAHLKLSRYADSRQAAECGLHAARLAGDRRDQARFLGTIALGLYWGPLPVGQALAHGDALVTEAEGSRTVEAFVLRARGVLLAMQGRFAEARSCVAQAADIHGVLGQRPSAAGAATEAGTIELLAGAPEAAERVLRDATGALEAIGYRTFQAVAAARLAQALYGQQRFDEAAQVAAETLSSAATDDVFPRVVCLAVSAKVLARRGASAEAEACCRLARDVAAMTDDLKLQGDALIDLAYVLSLDGRHDEAAARTAEAIALYERKGDIVSAGRARRAARLGTRA